MSLLYQHERGMDLSYMTVHSMLLLSADPVTTRSLSGRNAHAHSPVSKVHTCVWMWFTHGHHLRLACRLAGCCLGRREHISEPASKMERNCLQEEELQREGSEDPVREKLASLQRRRRTSQLMGDSSRVNRVCVSLLSLSSRSQCLV